MAERLQRELALRGLSLRQVETASGVNFRTLKKLLDGGTVRTARLTPLAEFLG